MQVNSINKTNFQAKIVPSEALSYALEFAQEEAKTGTKNGLKMHKNSIIIWELLKKTED